MSKDFKLKVYYPVFIDLTDRTVIVIGGNKMAEEKTNSLLLSKAKVVLIGMNITDNLLCLVNEKKISWINRSYKSGDLANAFLAIVADTSDTDINNSVYQETHKLNILLNVMDVTHLCTFIAPAISRRGEVTAAVSTGGASPALARKFRELLNGTTVDKTHQIMEYAELIPYVKEARKEIRRRGINISPNHWQACINEKLLDLVLNGNSEEAKSLLWENLMKGNGCGCLNDGCELLEHNQ